MRLFKTGEKEEGEEKESGQFRPKKKRRKGILVDGPHGKCFFFLSLFVVTYIHYQHLPAFLTHFSDYVLKIWWRLDFEDIEIAK
jgi:hypothetical protein